MTLISLFYNFIGLVSLVVYVYMIFKLKANFVYKYFAVILALCLVFLYHVFLNGFVESLIMYRFHWGFFAFYLFFKGCSQKYNITPLFLVMIVMIFLEVFAVNFFINVVDLPNYPLSNTASQYISGIYSYGGNASITSVLLISILPIIEVGAVLYFSSFLAIFFIGSGSGLFLFILYSLFSKINMRKISIYMISFIFIAYLESIYESSIFYKISFDYFNIILDIKINKILNILSTMSWVEIFFGAHNAHKIVGGDAAWLNFFFSSGIVGVSIMAFLLLSNINKFNAFSIFIIFIGTFHYYVLFSLPGQLITGYILTVGSKYESV